jgi:WD40 repeat protein
MIGPSGDHPSAEQLPAFALGLLDPEQTAAVERHVAGCDSCCLALQAVPDDGLVRRLRQAASTRSDGLPHPAATLSLSGTPAPALPPELAAHPRYQVEKLLGVGGMGAVYRAYHRVMGRPVALKVINQILTTKPAMVERFAREGKAAARLSHPNIVTAFDAEQAGPTHFLVMEYVEGTDLGRLVAEQGPLAVDRACDYVRQAALGLQHAFENGMVHRDVKPHNLMLTPGGQVKILDFGLARFASEAASEAGVTASGTVLGTVDYIAPEQADNAHQADIRADIYSLGCTLYHLLAGRPPFPTGTPIQKVMAHIEKEPPPLTEHRNDLPEELMLVLERMMAKDPARRYQTPAAVAEALRPFIDPAFLRGLRKASAPRPTPGKRRRKRLVAAALALLLLGGGLLGVAVYRIQTDNGELVITTDNADVEVVIKQNGKLVRIIDTKTNKEVKLESGLYELELKGKPEDLKLSLDRVTVRRGGKVVATIERQPADPVGQIRRFDLLEACVLAVAFSPDGRLALSSTGDDQGAEFTIHVWEVKTGKEIRSLEGHSGKVWGAVFSPDGKRILSCSQDRTLRVWDVETGKELKSLEGHPEGVLTVAISPDGKRALSGGWDQTVRLWDLESGKELKVLEGHTHHVRRVAFSPDGKRALSGGWDKAVRLWDLETGATLKTLEGHTDIVHGVAFLPDGRRAVSCAFDGTIRLWDLESGKQTKEISGPDEMHGLALSADGRRLLTAAWDRTLRLWDLEGGKELHCFQGHKNKVNTAAFSPDGHYALSGGDDRIVRLWRLPALAPAEKP